MLRFDNAPEEGLNLSLNSKVLEMARELGMNVSPDSRRFARRRRGQASPSTTPDNSGRTSKDGLPQTPTEMTPRPIRSQYEDFMRHVDTTGVFKADRTGTGTKSVFGHQMRFDLNEGFPLVTTKKVHLKSIIQELLWFLTGSSNNNWLKERGVTIWDEWAREDGDLGPVYGVQWRSWPTPDGGHIDQIAEVVNTLKTNPDSRRIIVSAWNVAELSKMALMPCHAFFQFYVAPPQAGGERGKLSCQLYQRSADIFLGVPFNIASYALLTHMVAQQCDLDVGDFIWTGGDCHIYSNHAEQVALQLGRTPHPYPTLHIKRKPASIFDYEYEDFRVRGKLRRPAIPRSRRRSRSDWEPNEDGTRQPHSSARAAQRRDRPGQHHALVPAGGPGALQAHDARCAGDHGAQVVGLAAAQVPAAAGTHQHRGHAPARLAGRTWRAAREQPARSASRCANTPAATKSG